MTRALVDTDILSEILKGIDPTVVTQSQAYLNQHERFTVSAVTVMEIVKGFQRVGAHRRLGRFLAEIHRHEILPFDAPAAELAGRIYGDLERTGRTIGRADPQVAATALHHDLTLVTGNATHYERIRALGYQLELEDWREKEAR